MPEQRGELFINQRHFPLQLRISWAVFSKMVRSVLQQEDRDFMIYVVPYLLPMLILWLLVESIAIAQRMAVQHGRRFRIGIIQGWEFQKFMLISIRLTMFLLHCSWLATMAVCISPPTMVQVLLNGIRVYPSHSFIVSVFPLQLLRVFWQAHKITPHGCSRALHGLILRLQVMVANNLSAGLIPMKCTRHHKMEQFLVVQMVVIRGIDWYATIARTKMKKVIGLHRMYNILSFPKIFW